MDNIIESGLVNSVNMCVVEHDSKLVGVLPYGFDLNRNSITHAISVEVPRIMFDCKFYWNVIGLGGETQGSPFDIIAFQEGFVGECLRICGCWMTESPPAIAISTSMTCFDNVRLLAQQVRGRLI